MAKPTSSVPLGTSLSPVAHGVLSALALREDPAHAEANGVITRLLREELDRIAPGVWDELVQASLSFTTETIPAPTAREVSCAMADRIPAILRARAAR
jgi:hypothetical protein